MKKGRRPSFQASISSFRARRWKKSILYEVCILWRAILRLSASLLSSPFLLLLRSFATFFLQYIEYRNYGSIKQSLDIKRTSYDHFHRKDYSKLFVNSMFLLFRGFNRVVEILLRNVNQTE